MSEVPLYILPQLTTGNRFSLGLSSLTYRGTSPIRNSTYLGPYSRTMPRALWKPLGGRLFCDERGIPVPAANES